MPVTTRPTESPAARDRETAGPAYVQRRLHVEEYHRMIEAGILDEEDKVELLEGVLVEMSPQGEPHARAITRLTKALVLAADEGFVVRPQVPLTLGDFSEPEPDLAVVRVSDAESRTAHPRTALLVIEVSKDSLRKDRGIKAAIYASAGIPNYWIVTVDTESVEAYGDPDPDARRYRRLVTFQRGATLEVEGLPRLSLPVAALFD
jgi:Uma2 family endonuclease